MGFGVEVVRSREWSREIERDRGRVRDREGGERETGREGRERQIGRRERETERRRERETERERDLTPDLSSTLGHLTHLILDFVFWDWGFGV